MRRGELDLADELIRRALELSTLPEVSCEYDARRAIKEFAVLLIERGDSGEAARLLDDAIAASRRDGQLDALAVRLMVERADLAYMSFDFARALELSREAMRLQGALGTNDFKLAMHSSMALAGALRKTGRVSEALEIQRDVLERSVSALGEDDDDVLASRNNYALTLGDAGRCVEAIDELGRLVEVARGRFGAGHLVTLSLLNNMADRCVLAGQRDRAADLYSELVRVARGSSFSRHPTLVSIRNTIVIFLAEQQRYEEGLELSDELVALGGDTFASEPDTQAYFHGRMGFMLHKLGRHADGVLLLELCVEMLAGVHGADAPEDRGWRKHLADARAALVRSEAVSMVTQ
jgi:tetratricopeptide (TPR) repeat protein